jgi:hypothetical protein
MLSLIDGAATAHTISSLRAACAMLDGDAGRISAVSVSGVLPDADDGSVPILTVAQRLAGEHGLAVSVDVEGRRFVVQFRRGDRPIGTGTSEAG